MQRNTNTGNKIHLLFFSLLTSIGVFWYLFTKVSLSEVVTAVKNVSPSWIVLFLLFSFSMSIFRTWRYQVILHTSGEHAPSIPLFLITLVRNFFSDLLPARLGTLIYIYLVKSRLSIPIGPVVSSFAHAFLFDIISLAILILPAVITVSAGEMSRPVLIVLGFALGAVSIILLLSLPRICRICSVIVRKLTLLPQSARDTVVHFLLESEEHLNRARKHKIYLKLLALSFAVRICKYGSLYALLIGLVLPFGYSVADFPVNKVFLGLCSAEFAASLPVSGIAGFGAYEGAWALVFQLLGYPERIAVLSSIAHHLLTQVYGYSLGGLALLLLLLPVFSRMQSKKQQNLIIEERWFWMKYAGSILAVVILTMSALMTIVDVGQAVGEDGKGKGTIASEIHLPAGRLVYERPDGIYIYDTKKKRSKRIAENGRNPRFSPDGELVAFIRGNAIMTVTDGGNRMQEVAHSEKPRTLCFAATGDAVLFSDGETVKQVNLKTKKVVELLRDGNFREIAINKDGLKLVATVKTLTGLKVKAFDLRNNEARTVDRGCSATISPDGKYVTVNAKDHRKLKVFDWEKLEKRFNIKAPSGRKFDNHYWSSSNDWLVSTAEGERHDIYIHHVPSGWNQKITTTGDCDRAHFYLDE